MIEMSRFLLILLAISGTALFTACEEHPPEQTALFLKKHKKEHGDAHGKKEAHYDDKAHTDPADKSPDAAHEKSDDGHKPHTHGEVPHEKATPTATPTPVPKRAAPLFPPASSE